MLRLASDADVHGDLIRGLKRRNPGIDLIRAQDFHPDGTPDVDILEWAAREDRVLISNDRSTMIDFAHQRVAADKNMPGLICTSPRQPIGAAINNILLIAEYLSGEEVRQQVVIYLPYWQ